MIKMKTLVTGGTGFVGSHLVDALVAKGKKVRCLVKKETDTAHPKYFSNVEHLKKLGVEIIYGNLTDKNSLKKAVKDVNVIFHLAAIARPMHIPDKLYFEVNIEGTKNLLDAVKNKKIKKIVCMSSISAIGPSRDGKPVNEKTIPRPADVYGESKLAAERIIKESNLPVIILRPPMIFGPRDFEMLRFFKTVKSGFFPIRSNKGHFEFCYVENIVQACLLAEKKGKIREIYCISNEKSYTINEVIKTMAEEENVKLINFYFPAFIFQVGGFLMELLGKIFRFHPPFSRETIIWMTKNYWFCDISKAKKELGYKPKINLKEGIKRTVNWYKEKGLL